MLSTKEKLKQAALSLFAKRGYEGTTMNDIAERVGINKASIYNHCKNKEALFLAVYQDDVIFPGFGGRSIKLDDCLS